MRTVVMQPGIKVTLEGGSQRSEHLTALTSSRPPYSPSMQKMEFKSHLLGQTEG